MSNTTSNDTPAVAEETPARVSDTAMPAAAKQSGPGVYDAPSRAAGLPLGMIVGIVVALVIVAFLLFQFVF